MVTNHPLTASKAGVDRPKAIFESNPALKWMPSSIEKDPALTPAEPRTHTPRVFSFHTQLRPTQLIKDIVSASEKPRQAIHNPNEAKNERICENYMQKCEESEGTAGSPEVIVHRFKEKLVVWFLESVFQVQKGDPFGRDGQFDQVWSFLVVEVVDNFSLPHCRPLGRSERRASSAGAPDAPPEWALARFHPPADFLINPVLSLLPCLPPEIPGIFSLWV